MGRKVREEGVVWEGQAPGVEAYVLGLVPGKGWDPAGRGGFEGSLRKGPYGWETCPASHWEPSDVRLQEVAGAREPPSVCIPHLAPAQAPRCCFL